MFFYGYFCLGFLIYGFYGLRHSSQRAVNEEKRALVNSQAALNENNWLKTTGTNFKSVIEFIIFFFEKFEQEKK